MACVFHIFSDLCAFQVIWWKHGRSIAAFYNKFNIYFIYMYQCWIVVQFFSFHKFSILVICNSELKMQKKTSNSHRPNLKSKTKHLLAMLRWFVLINDCYLLQMPFFPILIFHPFIYIIFFFFFGVYVPSIIGNSE